LIVTFYSFKGGVGRSMALVNVAELLADRGYKVIICDWDLEAPGLERYVAAVPMTGNVTYKEGADAKSVAERYTAQRGLSTCCAATRKR
jgi:cellulose biosynthesis protein BcsQ